MAERQATPGPCGDTSWHLSEPDVKSGECLIFCSDDYDDYTYVQ